MKTDRYISLPCALPEGQVPEWIHVLPMGLVNPKGRRMFLADQTALELILQIWAGDSVDMVVDYEHQSLYGDRAPAAGWVTQLEIRDTGLWASVTWTDAAAGYIRAREYRYISPVVIVRESDNRAVELLSIALTNTPAIRDLTPVVNKASTQEEETMDKKLLAALGLPEDATVDQAIAAVVALKSAVPKEVAEVLSLRDGSTALDATRKIRELQAGMVPLSEHVRLQEELAKRDASEAVELALSAGKITPAQKEWALKYAADDLEGFRAFTSTAPAAVPLGKVSVPSSSDQALDAADLAVCKQLGISAEAYKAAKAKE